MKRDKCEICGKENPKYILYTEVIPRDQWRGTYERKTFCSEEHLKYAIGERELPEYRKNKNKKRKRDHYSQPKNKSLREFTSEQ